jgi:phospholipase/carboxylesterase
MTHPPLHRIDGSALRFHLAGATEQPRSILLLLHGSGSDAANLLPLTERLALLLPGTLFVLPNAPQSYVDVLSREEIAATVAQRPDIDWERSRTWVGAVSESSAEAGGRGQALLDSLRPPVRALSRFADLLLAQHGLSDASLAVYGFSQGGMIAAYFGIQRPQPCAGIICHSGQFYGAHEVHSRPRTLVMVGSQELDPALIMCHVHPLTLQALRRLDIPVEEIVIDGLNHGINREVLDRCSAFLSGAFASSDTARSG